MIRLYFLTLTITASVICSLDASKNDESAGSMIVNKVFCACSDIEFKKEQKNEIELIKDSITDILMSVFSLKNTRENTTDLHEWKCHDKLVFLKCDDPETLINVILATVGTHANNCSDDNSTFNSLLDQRGCYESLKSTMISASRCDNKNSCMFSINDEFSTICDNTVMKKHLNVVYSCSKPDNSLDRSKRHNKWEADIRSRNSVDKGPLLSLPIRFDERIVRPYSFRVNQALWGSRNYDYVNFFNAPDVTRTLNDLSDAIYPVYDRASDYGTPVYDAYGPPVYGAYGPTVYGAYGPTVYGAYGAPVG